MLMLFFQLVVLSPSGQEMNQFMEVNIFYSIIGRLWVYNLTQTGQLFIRKWHARDVQKFKINPFLHFLPIWIPLNLGWTLNGSLILKPTVTQSNTRYSQLQLSLISLQFRCCTHLSVANPWKEPQMTQPPHFPPVAKMTNLWPPPHYTSPPPYWHCSRCCAGLKQPWTSLQVDRLKQAQVNPT